VGDDEYEVDASALTFGEIAEVESHFDRDYDDLFSTQASLAVIYTAMKRTKPTTTWANVEALPVSAPQIAKPKRPTQAAPEAAGTPAS
jgi:hypothetical protein